MHHLEMNRRTENPHEEGRPPKTQEQTFYKAGLKTVAETAKAAFFDMKLSYCHSFLVPINYPRNSIASSVRLARKKIRHI